MGTVYLTESAAGRLLGLGCVRGWTCAPDPCGSSLSLAWEKTAIF